MGFMYIMQAIKKYDLNKGSNFSGYFKGAVTKNFFNEIRKKAKMRFDVSLEEKCDDNKDYLGVTAIDFNLEEEITYMEDIKRLIEAINLLSDDEKEFIKIVFGNKYGFKKYSELRKIKYSACSKKKKRIINKLGKIMDCK